MYASETISVHSAVLIEIPDGRYAASAKHGAVAGMSPDIMRRSTRCTTRSCSREGSGWENDVHWWLRNMTRFISGFHGTSFLASRSTWYGSSSARRRKSDTWISHMGNFISMLVSRSVSNELRRRSVFARDDHRCVFERRAWLPRAGAAASDAELRLVMVHGYLSRTLLVLARRLATRDVVASVNAISSSRSCSKFETRIVKR